MMLGQEIGFQEYKFTHIGDELIGYYMGSDKIHSVYGNSIRHYFRLRENILYIESSPLAPKELAQLNVKLTFIRPSTLTRIIYRSHRTTKTGQLVKGFNVTADPNMKINRI